MQLEDMMKKDLEFVTPDDTLDEASEKMTRLGLNEMPVFENNVPVAMLSKQDMSSRVFATGETYRNVMVRDVMKRAL
jgi:predicted transcriptional regulator